MIVSGRMIVRDHSLVHQRFDLGLDVFELGQLEAVLLHFLLLVGRSLRLLHFHLGGRLLAVILQHLQHRVSLFLQLGLLFRVDVADHVFNRSGRTASIDVYRLGMP